MAVIAIFCDGTWNSPGAETHTHVLREADCCLPEPGQIALYFPGVGTGTGMVSDIGRRISRIGGGLFGWGLNRNIRAAYLELCRIYQPGDKIMIFGFSRGAYTARSLVGMIRKCGILERPTRLNALRAFRLYRRRGAKNAPDMPSVMAARRRLSPGFATSQADVEMRGDGSNLVRITYLGVWDTVGALGIPQAVLGGIARAWNKRYQFHDTSLSGLVEQARHAVALDEKRVLYAPSLWDNLDTRGGDPGLNQGDQSPQRPYQQVWFAGNHSVLGGSSEIPALGALPAAFIMEEAIRLGLRTDRSVLTPPDARAPAPDLYKVAGLYRFFPALLRWRSGPQTPRGLHASVLTRMAQRAEYRPHSLKWLFPELFDDH
ncbi:DUF2235 domain-containing protein [uncultured Roseobacter sp.]|uniref:DUF2235 domain-containing protein n=1 Tax=uncultured Roseobacter sp. TaxID=114847 RepID=UPI00261B4A78|nr:DUF2235 domain-containing protein [uncultured Roseobacter sp.]